METTSALLLGLCSLTGPAHRNFSKAIRVQGVSGAMEFIGLSESGCQTRLNGKRLHRPIKSSAPGSRERKIALPSSLDVPFRRALALGAIFAAALPDG